MTGCLLAVFAVLLAVLFAVLRAGYGDLRLSELPVMLLALLAGSDERGRLRLILRHREPRRHTQAQTLEHEGVPVPGFGPIASMFLPEGYVKQLTPEGYVKHLYPCPGCGVRQQRIGSASYCRHCGWKFPATTGTLADLRRERPARKSPVRDSQARSESFWAHIDEARRLTEQIKAANGVPPAAIGDETADDERLSNLRWERPS